MPTQKLTNEIISAAILGFEEQKRHLDAQIAELRAMQTGSATGAAAAPQTAKRGRRKISAAGRKAMAEAQRKRWAAYKAPAVAAPEAVSKPKRKLSAAGRKAIVAALKKRWALKKTEAAQAK